MRAGSNEQVNNDYFELNASCWRISVTDQVEKPCCLEMTDEQSFREMVESFVKFRPSSERRRFPRFPTLTALAGQLGLDNIDGTLIMQPYPEECRDAVQKAMVHIVDFSESGVQLQLDHNDFQMVQRSSLYLEIQSHRILVQLKWWKQCGAASRAGFLFKNRIDSDEFLTNYISGLNTQLIVFMMAEHLNLKTEFKKQGGVFIFLSILYGLRLKFLEAIARLNSSIGPGNYEQKSANAATSFGSYSSAYQLAQNTGKEFDVNQRIALRNYMKPYYELGCGVIGMHEDRVLTKGEVIFVIFSSVLFKNDDSCSSTEILPELYLLHNHFLSLKHLLMPGVFEDEVFEIQFEHYSSVIQQIEQSRNIRQCAFA